MSVRFGVLVATPVLLLATVFPGSGSFGGLTQEDPLPASVGRAEQRADLTPLTGGTVRFNDPHGSRSEQYALVRMLNRAIGSAAPGATIRVAAYSLAMDSTAEALVAAHRAGRDVRVVVDDHSRNWGAVRLLRSALGTDPDRRSFVKVCARSCRGTRGVQHIKFLTVSRGSLGDGAVMVGSLNLTDYSSREQWNDMYAVADPALHRQFAGLFDALVRDRPEEVLDLPETSTGFRTDVSPYSAGGPDPISDRLGAVRCRDAAPGYGRGGRTSVRIAMHAWNGERGIALARDVTALGDRGCDVKVLFGSGMGGAVATILRRSEVDVRDSASRGRRVHEKVMFLSGAIADHDDASLVWTGSHNWSDRSTRNDEIIVRVAGEDLVAAYERNFAEMWRRASPEPAGCAASGRQQCRDTDGGGGPKRRR